MVDIAPKLASAFPSLPKDATVVNVTAFMRSTHAPVTSSAESSTSASPTRAQGAHPLTSEDGTTWRDIPQLQTLNLPPGQADGWFRDSDGTIHVLSPHLSYFALVGQEVSTELAMRIMTVRRLWLRNRSFVAVRMSLTAPARVTGVFVAPDGSRVPGQTIKTPTRHAGVTILRVPLRITQPGLYKLQMHAEGAGQVVNRTAKINFMPTRPRSPIWQDGALRVAVVRGARGLSSLRHLLGKHFVVAPDRRRGPLRRARHREPHGRGRRRRRPRHRADLHARRAPRAAAGGADRRADRDAGQGRVLPAASA